jgi:hypothetical protein
MATANTALVRTEQRLSGEFKLVCRRTTSPLAGLRLSVGTMLVGYLSVSVVVTT